MNKSLTQRLTAVALSLPGLMQDVKAGREQETVNTDFLYGHYQESDDRMHVDVFNLSFSLPFGKAVTAAVDLVRDTIGGASPMFNIRDAKNQVRQVLSGASIHEQRDAISASIAYAFEDIKISLGGGVSNENDYLSRFFNTGISWNSKQKLTTVNASVALAFDEVSPTGKNYTRSKTGQQYLLGITQVINKNSVLRSNMTFSYQHGFLSDPYKLVFVERQGLKADSRPEHRFQWAWLTRYTYAFKRLNNAALHADYRLYLDDWGINAHMVELSWHQPVLYDWHVIPRIRYYTQSQADFYSPVFNADTVGEIHSSDYRLAGFGALGGGVKLSKVFYMSGLVKDIKIQAAFDFYDRKAGYQIGGYAGGDFDDFSFYMVTASLNAKF